MKVGFHAAPRAVATATYAPKYELFEYAYNDATHRYHKTAGGERLPYWLRLDPVRDPSKYRNITHFLCSQQIGRSKAVNSGLQGVGLAGGYAGDLLPIEGKKSLMAVQFNEAKTQMTVYVFWNYWKERTAHRLNFVKRFLIENRTNEPQ
jgi:hypothetical protein